MHRVVREALEDAKGESQRVIVVFIDIRKFSEFSQQCDSADVAAFIRKVYMTIIDTYFSFASFYKSTGDGLFFTIPWEEKNLKEMCQKVIESCITCHSEFGTLFYEDLSINFDVPHNIGIGVARGTACCLISGETIIDYSGRLLNLTSRLTGIARPSGIVIDGKFGIELLSEEQQRNFKEADVYLDGIAEDEPIRIYFSKEFTTIPQRNRQPIAVTRWQYVRQVKPYRELLKRTLHRHILESAPTSRDDIKVTIAFPKVISGKVQKDLFTYFDYDFTYNMEAGRPIVHINYKKLCEILKRRQVKKNMNVNIEIAYVEK